MAQTLTIDQRNYKRVQSDHNHAVYRQKRIQEQLDAMTADLNSVEDEIKSTQEWLDEHKQFETPEPRYNIRNSVAVDEKEQAWKDQS